MGVGVAADEFDIGYKVFRSGNDVGRFGRRSKADAVECGRRLLAAYSVSGVLFAGGPSVLRGKGLRVFVVSGWFLRCSAVLLCACKTAGMSTRCLLRTLARLGEKHGNYVGKRWMQMNAEHTSESGTSNACALVLLHRVLVQMRKFVVFLSCSTT